MTYRERREAKAERLREWAGKREAKASAAFQRADQIADMIPMGQPILVGHYSEKRHRADLDRINRGMGAGFEHAEKAKEFDRRAAGIDHQLETSIYSDDADAIPRLWERVWALEAERDRIKAYNASCRKGAPELGALDDSQRETLAMVTRVAAWQLGKGGAFPGYALSNLSGNIARLRKRLAELINLWCEVPGCGKPALHRSGWGNGDSLVTCLPHTNEREKAGAWSKRVDT